MPLRPTTAAALRAAGVDFQEDAPLRNRTWWRAGGPADALVQVEELDALRAVLRACSTTGCPSVVLGNASNVLVADAGIEGVVIKLGGALARIEADDRVPPVLALGGGAKLMTVVSRMTRHGWTGLELFAGIPGTVGGAVRMNAGTVLGEVSQRLLEVELALADGGVTRLPTSALAMSYRTAVLPAGSVVATAWFQTTGGDPEESRRLVAEHLDYRARTQPVDVPTCGSTFRNPPGTTAGRLIDQAGLKGTRIGGAEVSTKHANFIVNTGTATAGELRALVEAVRARVLEVHGVLLEPEVHFLGRWEVGG